jgi:ATP/maltotriose-dependent transcriptional regulator MalT
VRGFSPADGAALEAVAVHEVIDDATIEREFDPAVRVSLEGLARRGAMVSRTSTQALRVHPMLRDVVVEGIRRRDGSAAIRALHSRAAAHYGERGAIGAALFHLESADDPELTRTLIRRFGSEVIVRGFGERVRRLTARMQERGVDDAVLVAYVDGWIAKTTGRADRRERFVEALALADAADDATLGFAARLETVEYDLSRGLPVERGAIEDLLGRAAGLGMAEAAAAAIRAGWDAVLRGEPERSLALVERFAGLDAPIVRNALAPLRAYAFTLLGRFSEAEREMTALLESLHDADSLALRGRMLVWSARLALLRGDTQLAWDDIREADRTGAPFLAGSETAAFAITLAECAIDKADLDLAERAIAQARQFAPSAWYERDRVRVPALAAHYEARLYALRDGPAAALAAAEAALASGIGAFAPGLASDAAAYAARTNGPLRMRIEAAVEAICGHVVADASDAVARASAADVLVRIDPRVAARLPALDSAPFGALIATRASAGGGPRFEQTLFAEQRPSAEPEASAHERLTAREAEILDLLALGLTNKEIAQRFVLSPRTVETHVARILGKVGVNSRSRAIAAYMRKTTDGRVGLARL